MNCRISITTGEGMSKRILLESIELRHHVCIPRRVHPLRLKSAFENRSLSEHVTEMRSTFCKREDRLNVYVRVQQPAQANGSNQAICLPTLIVASSCTDRDGLV